MTRKRPRASSRSKRELLQEKNALDEAVRSGKLEGRTYADEVNERTNEYLQRIAAVIGPADYQQLFQLPAREPVGIVDPTTARTPSTARQRSAE